MKTIILFSILLFTQLCFGSYFIPDNSITVPKVHTSNVDSRAVQNCSITSSVASSALTIALKNAAGADPSATSPCRIAFRNATAATGTTAAVTAIAATSLVISNGSALGCVASVACSVYVYAVNNGGTIVLGAIGQTTLDEGSLQTSTAEGGSGGADTTSVLYTAATQTTKAVRLLGRLTITPGASFAWSANSTEISNVPFGGGGDRAVVLFGRATSACASSPCTLIYSSPGITNVTRSSTGAYTINFTAGTFSVAPSCTVTAQATTSVKTAISSSVATTTAWNFGVWTVGTTPVAADDAFSFVCVGYK